MQEIKSRTCPLLAEKGQTVRSLPGSTGLGSRQREGRAGGYDRVDTDQKGMQPRAAKEHKMEKHWQDHTRCTAALGTLVLCTRSGVHSALSAQ